MNEEARWYLFWRRYKIDCKENGRDYLPFDEYLKILNLVLSEIQEKDSDNQIRAELGLDD